MTHAHTHCTLRDLLISLMFFIVIGKKGINCVVHFITQVLQPLNWELFTAYRLTFEQLLQTKLCRSNKSGYDIKCDVPRQSDDAHY